MSDEKQTPEVEPTQETEQAPEQSLNEQHGLPEQWTENQVKEWLKWQEQNPDLPTKAGELMTFDPTRKGRPINEWLTEELNAYLKGELSNITNKLLKAVAKEYARRESVPDAWSPEELVTYLKDGVEPAKDEATGIWMSDVTRASRDASDWSDAELKAYKAGTIKAEGKVTPALLDAEIESRGFNKQQTAPAAKAAPAPASAKGNLTAMNVSFIEGSLQSYADTVAVGKPASEETGGIAQRRLDRVFQYVIGLEGPAMLDGLNEIRDFVRKHAKHGVFSPSHAYRFTHMLKGSTKEQQLHINFIELFIMVTGKSPSQRKQIDIPHMLKGVPADKLDALVDYFTNYA